MPLDWPRGHCSTLPLMNVSPTYIVGNAVCGTAPERAGDVDVALEEDEAAGHGPMRPLGMNISGQHTGAGYRLILQTSIGRETLCSEPHRPFIIPRASNIAAWLQP